MVYTRKVTRKGRRKIWIADESEHGKQQISANIVDVDGYGLIGIHRPVGKNGYYVKWFWSLTELSTGRRICDMKRKRVSDICEILTRFHEYVLPEVYHEKINSLPKI